MPGSSTTPGWPSARVGALGHIAFHYTDSVGTRYHFSIAAQWLACTFPCRRFADILADACARLGADVGGCRVEAPVTQHLPHRSHRAAFPQWALVEGQTRSRVRSLAARRPPIRRLAASVTRRTRL